MTIKTRKDYLQALRQLRPNIYKFGELIEDVTTHPATKRTVEHSRGIWTGLGESDVTCQVCLDAGLVV